MDLAGYRGQTAIESVVHDIRNEPVRMGELQLHKLGLLWSNWDIPNNVDYQRHGLESSLVLNTLALGGTIGTTALLFLALGTLFSGYPARRDLWLLLTFSLLLLTVSTVAFTVFGRMRSQIWPPMAIIASVGIVSILRDRRWWQIEMAFVAASLVLLTVHKFELGLPNKRFLATLPSDALVYEHRFNDHVRMVGLDPVESNHVRGGYVYVTLYWQIIDDHEEDQSVFIHLADPVSGRINGTDHNIGQVTYPTVGTSQWKSGDILKKSYLVSIPQDAPDVVSVIAGVYERNSVELFRIGMLDAEALADDLATSASAVFEGNIEVHNIQFTEQVRLNETVIIQADWTTKQPVFEDYVWFVHLIDNAGNLVAQSDDRVLTETWTTSALVPGSMLHAERQIQLGSEISPGEYTVMMGLYRISSLARLSVVDGQSRVLANNLVTVGIVTVSP